MRTVASLRRGPTLGEGEFLPLLPEDFVEHGRRNAVDAEAAGGEVVAVAHEPLHGFGHGHDFIDEPARLLGERGASRIRIGPREEGGCVHFRRVY